MHGLRRGALAALVAAATITGVATAQGDDAFSVTLTPNVADKGTVVDVEVDGAKLGAAGNGPAPTGARLVAQKGFRFDPEAVAETCTDDTACPAGSRVGSGTANATVTFLGASRPVVADITAFRGTPVKSGDLAGIVVDVNVPGYGQRFTAKGRALQSAEGLELRFDDIAGAGQVPAGVSFRLDKLSLNVGAHRTVTVTRTKTRKVKTRSGKTVRRKVKVRVKVRRDLLKTPRSCDRTWTARGVITFADGLARTEPFSIPCRT
ncbi:MAG: hypothetical protein ACEQSX_16690 [Baekduiaceae bacterium]